MVIPADMPRSEILLEKTIRKSSGEVFLICLARTNREAATNQFPTSASVLEIGAHRKWSRCVHGRVTSCTRTADVSAELLGLASCATRTAPSCTELTAGVKKIFLRAHHIRHYLLRRSRQCALPRQLEHVQGRLLQAFLRRTRMGG